MFPDTSDYFNGHFPEFKILPAVVQIDMVVTLAHAFLEVPKAIANMRRAKFLGPVFPNVALDLKVMYDLETSKLLFTYVSLEGKILSSGNLTVALNP